MNLTRLRSGIWQVELRIPIDVREQIGRIRFAKSTGTRDKQEARRKSLDLLSQWHREIEAVRSKGGPSGFCEGLSDTYSRTLVAYGEDPIKPSDPIVGPPRRSVSSAFDIDAQYALEVHAEAFVSEHYTSGRSQLEAKRYIREVSVFIPTLADLKRCNAQSWLRAEVKKPLTSRRAVKTMQKGVGLLSEYFAWLRSNGVVPPDSNNPFKELHFSKTLSRSRQYLPLSTDELQQLRNASEANSDDLLTTYIDIARFTGMRLSEIGELTSQSVVEKQGFKCFRVRPDAKTEASSNRLVPIAPALEELVALDGLDLRGTSNAVGKRFGRLKRVTLADGDSRQKCFHSIRKSVVTILEQSGVAEGVAADLVGHEKPNITYNVYSGGCSVGQLYDAILAVQEVQACEVTAAK